MQSQILIVKVNLSEWTLYLHNFLLDKRLDLGKLIKRLVLIHPCQILHSTVRLQVSRVELKHHKLEETAISGHALHHDGLLQDTGLLLQKDKRTSANYFFCFISLLINSAEHAEYKVVSKYLRHVNQTKLTQGLIKEEWSRILFIYMCRYRKTK